MQEAELPTEGLISIIDDDEDFREAIAGLMKSRGFTVEAFPSTLAFLSCPNVRNTSCLIVDVHMPRMTGIELHRRLVERKLPPRDLPPADDAFISWQPPKSGGIIVCAWTPAQVGRRYRCLTSEWMASC